MAAIKVEDPAGGNAQRRRLVGLDLARSTAVLCMVIYHFSYDLELFGYLAPRTTVTGGWTLFARLIAGSFLFLTGVGLVLAHGSGIRWRSFLRRLAIIGASAALITIGTYFAVPDRFVYFGILHCIAASSLIGLAFLRLPASLVILSAVIAFYFPALFRADVFNAAAFYWLGLSTLAPSAIDYVPVFPWLAPCLMGIAVAKIALRKGWLDLLATDTRLPILDRLAWPGRHSLPIYLLHQPILITTLWVMSTLVNWAG